jgi:hypothetical protein
VLAQGSAAVIAELREREYAAWLTNAGFINVRRVALGGPNDLMIGERGA